MIGDKEINKLKSLQWPMDKIRSYINHPCISKKNLEYFVVDIWLFNMKYYKGYDKKRNLNLEYIREYCLHKEYTEEIFKLIMNIMDDVFYEYKKYKINEKKVEIYQLFNE